MEQKKLPFDHIIDIIDDRPGNDILRRVINVYKYLEGYWYSTKNFHKYFRKLYENEKLIMNVVTSSMNR